MTLYDDLGGEEAIAFALDRFYEKVLDDDRLASYFVDVDMDALKPKQQRFFAMAFGGPNRYDGRDLRAAHARPRSMGLDEEGYELFMGYFRTTLEELGVPEPRVAEVMAIAETGRDDVLGR